MKITVFVNNTNDKIQERKEKETVLFLVSSPMCTKTTTQIHASPAESVAVEMQALVEDRGDGDDDPKGEEGVGEGKVPTGDSGLWRFSRESW